jgi:hypothetical protein
MFRPGHARGRWQTCGVERPPGSEDDGGKRGRISGVISGGLLSPGTPEGFGGGHRAGIRAAVGVAYRTPAASRLFDIVLTLLLTAAAIGNRIFGLGQVTQKNAVGKGVNVCALLSKPLLLEREETT